MSKEYVVAVVGATGAVGSRMIEMLESSTLPIKQVRLFATIRSAGKVLTFKGQDITVEETTENSFEGIDIALFSAGGGVSAKFAPYAVKAGAVVVDNTSNFRMNPDVPLVVPEVNAHALDAHNGIIACPNCSTIQMMVALEPIRQQFGLERIIVSTYQAVSGAGAKAIAETEREIKEVVNDQVDPKDVKADILPAGGDKKHYPIAFNALPQIDVFTDNDYTYEEMKMTNETVKIMGDPGIKVTATTVRVPVFYGHSESINIETKKKLSANEARAILSRAPGVAVYDNPGEKLYPMPIIASGEDEVFVGRIREDESIANGLNFWCVADNIRKGAALNAVQIAETLLERDLLQVRNPKFFLA